MCISKLVTKYFRCRDSNYVFTYPVRTYFQLVARFLSSSVKDLFLREHIEELSEELYNLVRTCTYIHLYNLLIEMQSSRVGGGGGGGRGAGIDISPTLAISNKLVDLEHSDKFSRSGKRDWECRLH